MFLLATGRTSQSRENTERNLVICQKRNWRQSVAYCKRLLGDIALVEKNLSEAKRYFTEALEIARNFGIPEEISRILLGMGKFSMTDDRLEEAQVNLGAALEIASQSSYTFIEVDIHNTWAELYLSQRKLGEAKEHSERALEMSEVAEYGWGQGRALHILGQVASMSDNQSEAQHFLKSAYTIRQRIRDPHACLTKELMEQL